MSRPIRPSAIAQAMLSLSDRHSPEAIALAARELLMKTGRRGQMPYVRAALRRLEEQQGDVVIESAAELPGLAREAVMKEIQMKYPGRAIREKINPGLIGGFRLWIGSYVIDHSAAEALRQLRKVLTEVGYAEYKQ